jgi:hypothetical protein
MKIGDLVKLSNDRVGKVKRMRDDIITVELINEEKVKRINGMFHPVRICRIENLEGVNNGFNK